MEGHQLSQRTLTLMREHAAANRDLANPENFTYAVLRVIHAGQCRDASCNEDHCRPLKNILNHVEVCNTLPRGELDVCLRCKRYMKLCYRHAMTCSDVNCGVPQCSNVKQKLRLVQMRDRARRLQVEHDARRPEPEP